MESIPTSRSDAVDIAVFLDKPNDEQAAEDAFYRSSEDERAAADLYRSLLYVGKAHSLLTFDEIVKSFGISFHDSVLELGGGPGFLSSYLKRLNPDLRVVFSDVSREAVEKSRQYERFFDVRLDEKWVTAAESTPFESESFANVVFFASFHHTQDPIAAVRECARILKPGGQMVLMFEPSCPAYLKPLYEFHVRREEVTEKYYTIGEYRRMFRAAGLSFEPHFYRSFLYRRSRASILYYVMMSALPRVLARAFPCSLVAVGRKPLVRGGSAGAGSA